MSSRILLAAMALFSSGCVLCHRSVPLPPVQNPVAGLNEVSVVPVGAETERSSARWTARLRNALLRVEGVDRVHVVDADETTIGSDDPYAIVATPHGLLEVNVLAFDAYYPPSALVEVNFYLPSRVAKGAWDPLTLDRIGAAPGSSPVTDGGPWLRFQKRFSADDHEVMQAIKVFARSAGDKDRGYDPVDRILRLSDRFIDFVLYESLKECFSRMDQKKEEEERDDQLSQLGDGRTRG